MTDTFLRHITTGAGFPLFATAMYNYLGVGWASSTLAFISIAFIPIPFVLVRQFIPLSLSPFLPLSPSSDTLDTRIVGYVYVYMLITHFFSINTVKPYVRITPSMLGKIFRHLKR